MITFGFILAWKNTNLIIQETPEKYLENPAYRFIGVYELLLAGAVSRSPPRTRNLLINDAGGLNRVSTGTLRSPTFFSSSTRNPTLHIRIPKACLEQQFIMRCGVVFLWVAVLYRMTHGYSGRGYRDLNRDAGHVSQNL